MMIILDVVVATLLLATIFYAWKLSKSISTFRESKKEMAQFINQFGSAIIQAEESIRNLKNLNKEIDSELRVNIERARFLANDLSFLIHKGNDVANRLENNFESSRQQNVKKTPVINSEFANRIERISPTISAPLMLGQKQKIIDNPITKKLAVQEALANLQRAAATQRSPVVKVPAPGSARPAASQDAKAKEKRLFDLLKFGKQLEVQK